MISRERVKPLKKKSIFKVEEGKREAINRNKWRV